MLHYLQKGVLNFLLNLREILPRCFQALVSRVSLRELLTELLHQLQPFLADGLRALFPKEGLRKERFYLLVKVNTVDFSPVVKK